MIDDLAQMYVGDVSSRCDQNSLLTPPELTAFYYNLTSQPYSYHQKYYGMISDHEDAFFHSADPACLVAFQTSAGINLHWLRDDRYVQYVLPTDHNTAPINRFRILRSDNNGASFNTIVPDTAALQYVDGDLIAGRTYIYKVVSIYANGAAPLAYLPYSDSVSVVVQAVAPAGPCFWLLSVTRTEDLLTASDPGSSQELSFAFGKYPDDGQAGSLSVVVYADQPVQPSVLPVNAVPEGAGYRYEARNYTATAGIGKSIGGYGFYLANAGINVVPGNSRYYQTNMNNRLLTCGFAQYLMNPANAEWRATFMDAAADYVNGSYFNNACQYDALFADNAFADLKTSGDAWVLSTLRPDSSGFPCDYPVRGEDYTDGVKQMLSETRTALGKPIYINGIHCDPLSVLSDVYLELDQGNAVDGAMQDGFVANRYGTWTGADFARRINKLRYAIQHYSVEQGKRIMVLSGASDYDNITRLYDMGAFYLVMESGGGVLYGRPPRCFVPEEYIDLGAPLQPSVPVVVPEDHLRAPFGMYKDDHVDPVVRCFDNGIVIVNANSYDTAVVNYSSQRALYGYAQLYQIFVDDNPIENGGRIWSVTAPINNEVSVPPGSAVFLTTSAYDSPEIAAVSEVPLLKCAPGDTVKPRLSVRGRSRDELYVAVWDSLASTNPDGTGGYIGNYDNSVALGAGDPLDSGLEGFDAVYSDSLAGLVPSSLYGAKTLRYEARSLAGVPRMGSITVSVVEPKAKFVNVPPVAAGVNYSGTPTASAEWDWPTVGGAGIKKNLLVGVDSGTGRAYELLNYSGDAQISYWETSESVYDVSPPPEMNTRDLSVADYDNDGWPDVFAANQTAPRLYHNEPRAGGGRRLVDRSVDRGVFAKAQNSWCGAWGDYDNDGRIDLFVSRATGSGVDPDPMEVSALPNYLLRNTVAADGSGQFVSQEAVFAPIMAGRVARWADIDGDSEKRPDLFLGGWRDSGGEGGAQVYLNGVGGFQLGQWPLGQFSVRDAAFVDVNNDHFLDLALIGTGAGEQWAYINDGTGHSGGAALPLRTNSQASAMRVVDYDLDGLRDLLMLPRSSDSGWLLQNDASVANDRFFSVAPYIGLGRDAIGAAATGVVTDLNDDGDSEVFFGRQIGSSASGVFYKSGKNVTGGFVDVPENHVVWVKPYSYRHNDDNIGVSISAQAGGRDLGTSIIDGRDVRCGRADKGVIVGIGSSSPPVSVTVTWPGGFQRTDQVLQAGGVVSIGDEGMTPQIQAGSVQATATARPDWSVAYTFTWRTLYRTDIDKDVVTVEDFDSSNPEGCYLGTRLDLKQGVEGVTVDIPLLVNGWYVHRVHWVHACGGPCRYYYWVTSGTALNSITFPANQSGRIVSASVCLTIGE